MAEATEQAVGNLIKSRGGLGGAQGEAPGGAAGGAQGAGGGPGGAPPMETAMKLMEVVVKRVSEDDPELAEKLAGAVSQVRMVIDEIAQSAGGAQPGGAQGGAPGSMRGTPMEGQNRGTPLQGSGISPS